MMIIIRQEVKVMAIKNTLTDLNNHLFAEMERLNDEDLRGEDMTTERMIKELRQLETKVRTGKKKNGEIRMQDMVVAVADRLEELNERVKK